MTEKSTSDVLREKLTERGVKWWPMRNNGYYEDRDTEFVVNGKKHTAHEWGDGLAVYNLTPEQAIAATLGSDCETELRDALNEVADKWAQAQIKAEDYAKENMQLKAKLEAATLGDDDYERKMDALLCRLTNGKFSKSRAYDLDFMESCINEEFESLYSEEIAATLGSGKLTAEQVRETVEKHWHDLPTDYDMPEATALPEYSYDWQAIADELNAVLGEPKRAVCSECGTLLSDYILCTPCAEKLAVKR